MSVSFRSAANKFFRNYEPHTPGYDSGGILTGLKMFDGDGNAARAGTWNDVISIEFNNNYEQDDFILGDVIKAQQKEVSGTLASWSPVDLGIVIEPVKESIPQANSNGLSELDADQLSTVKEWLEDRFDVNRF